MPNSNNPFPLRTIKSFVLREGRLTPRQKDALENASSHYLLSTEAEVNWEDIFPSHTSLVLEIGFGMGHALLQNALLHPESCFVGIEVYRPGIGNLLAALKTQQVDNVRVFYGDAVEILRRCIPNDSLNAVYIFFPDPWPKRRHHKRRLIQTEFIELIIQKLKRGGKIHLATDWEDYASHIESVLSSLKALNNTVHTDSFIQNKANRPQTKYEQRGQKLGHEVWDLIFEKI